MFILCLFCAQRWVRVISWFKIIYTLIGKINHVGRQIYVLVKVSLLFYKVLSKSQSVALVNISFLLLQFVGKQLDLGAWGTWDPAVLWFCCLLTWFPKLPGSAESGRGSEEGDMYVCEAGLEAHISLMLVFWLESALCHVNLQRKLKTPSQLCSKE